MIVCLCHRITDRDTEREARNGSAHCEELQDMARVATACGACCDCTHDVYAQACGQRAPAHRGICPHAVAA